MESQEILLVDLQPAHGTSSPAEVIKSQIHIESCTANFFSLYRYANGWQILVLSVSTCCAVIADVAIHLVSIVFGALAKEFINGHEKAPQDARNQVQHLTLQLVYIAIGAFVTTMISTWDFDVVGEQITHELQERYLSSVLQRNIAYFDVLGTGELTSYMDQDMQLIQAGISQKVSYIISGVSGFVAAIIVAFMYNQKFASIMISQPLALILWVGSMGYWLSITQKKGLTQYVKADNLAQGVLNAMRNVVAYRSQERYSRKYFDTLQRPAALEFRERLIFGVIVAGSFTTLPSHMALDDVSFDVLAGAFIALVGTTGSGKSSVINLVERFYTAQSGNIILSDKAIGEYDLDGYRQYLALVDQNPCLVGEDMRECLQSDERVISDDDILVALQGVGLANFVLSLPQGLSSPVLANGSSLSGGQRQRMAIAKAILWGPKILLLDEATSALDTASEKLVQEALKHAMKDRTTIAVAHRLKTIVDASKILVFDGGRIVEQGTHDELMHLRGKYWQIARLQMN